MAILKTSRVVYVFQDLWVIKSKIYVSSHQIQRANNIDKVNKFV